MFSQFWSVKKYCIESHNKYFSILVKKKHSSEFKIRDLIWWACYGFQKYLVKTPENENVPLERTSIHCATQETKPLMWLIFPRMIHKSKIKKNRFNGHLHLFFVDLQISYPYNIFFLIASNSKNSSKLWCRRTMWNRSMIASYSVLKKVLRKVYIVVLIAIPI